jgi:uncharacterized protein YegL
MRSKKKIWMLFTLALIGCLLIAGCPGASDDDSGKTGEEPAGDFVRVGAVAFSGEILGEPKALSNDLAGVKSFLESQEQGEGGTALCYAVSEAVKLLPEDISAEGANYAETYIVVFTDGKDNASSALYSAAEGTEGDVAQNNVYARAKADLAAVAEAAKLRSYVFGFTAQRGQSLPSEAALKELVVGEGEYKTFSAATPNATTSQITLAAETIGNRALAAARSFTVSTLDNIYAAEAPRYLAFTVKAKPSFNGLKSQEIYDSFEAALTRTGLGGEDKPVFTITKAPQYNYVTLDAEAIEPVVKEGHIEIPLKGIQFTKAGVPYVITEVTVKVSDDGENFYPDEEDVSVSSTAALDKRIGVILVVDYSQSMPETAYKAVKKAAGDFIETLSKVNAFLED